MSFLVLIKAVRVREPVSLWQEKVVAVSTLLLVLAGMGETSYPMLEGLPFLNGGGGRRTLLLQK